MHTLHSIMQNSEVHMLIINYALIRKRDKFKRNFLKQ